MSIVISEVIAKAKYNEGESLLVTDAELLQKCCDLTGARVALEIGSACGCSSIILGDKIRERAGHLYCIEPEQRSCRKQNIDIFDLADYITMICGKSPWVGLSEVPESLDILFIDGLHKTRWVLVDYHFWEPRARVGGIVIFHDWSGEGWIRKEVRRAIKIILETDKLKEVGRSKGRDKGAIAYQKLS